MRIWQRSPASALLAGALVVSACAPQHVAKHGMTPLEVQCPELTSPAQSVAFSAGAKAPVVLPVGADLLLTTAAHPQALPTGSPLCLARPTQPDTGMSAQRTYVYRATRLGTANVQLDLGETGVSLPVAVVAGTLPAASLRAPLTVTLNDAGKHVDLHVGQNLALVLGSRFRLPVTSDRAVLGIVSARGGYPGDDGLQAMFVALKTGRAEVSTSTDAACLHAKPPCEIPQQPFTVEVTVI